MEAIYFAVGVLTMVLVALAALAVYSTVMVTKLKKRIEEVLRYVHDETNNIYRNINENEDKLRGEMRCGEQELNLQMDQLNEHISQLTSSTDRRFDKMLSSFLSQEYEAKHSKEIIKG